MVSDNMESDLPDGVAWMEGHYWLLPGNAVPEGWEWCGESRWWAADFSDNPVSENFAVKVRIAATPAERVSYERSLGRRIPSLGKPVIDSVRIFASGVVALYDDKGTPIGTADHDKTVLVIVEG